MPRWYLARKQIPYNLEFSSTWPPRTPPGTLPLASRPPSAKVRCWFDEGASLAIAQPCACFEAAPSCLYLADRYGP